MKRIVSCESVTAGHPDKVCDQISDSVLDALLREDPLSRAAVECTASPDFVHVMGEVTTKANIDYEQEARKAIRRAGWTEDEYLFTDRTPVVVSIHSQSPDIARGVDSAASIGAGDQGIMFGYATDETEEGLPLAHVLARKLTQKLTDAREDGSIPFLRPDGKSQVSVEYDEGKIRRIDTIVLSAQHDEDIEIGQLREVLHSKVISQVIPDSLIDRDTKFFINPTGRFVLGGPAADTGLTGRKIIADTYSGYAPHGGGAFSGKDPTKVDRSASYLARNIALTIVKSGAAKQALVQLAWAIGISHPVSIFADTFSTCRIPDDRLADWISDNWDLTPKGIIDEFDLRRPIYADTARFGHFATGQSWETVSPDRTASLLRLLK